MREPRSNAQEGVGEPVLFWNAAMGMEEKVVDTKDSLLWSVSNVVPLPEGWAER